MSAWGSLWYRLWVFGGLVAVAGGSVALGLANPTDQRVIFAILPMIAVYVGGILFLQARAATAASSPMSTRAEQPATGADPPKGWQGLSELLAVKPIDPAAQRAARKVAGGAVLSGVRLTAVMMVLILIGVGLFYGGVDNAVRPFGETRPGFPLVFLPIFATIVVAVLRIPFAMRQSVSAADAHLEPLGLRIIKTPNVGVRPSFGGSGMQTATSGPTVMAGTRHGRSVRIELHGSAYETSLAVHVPHFEVESANGRLVASGRAPAEVRAALEPLSADARWRTVKADGGAGGIVVRRRVGSRQATEALWMDDLWLAEHLADAVEARRSD